MIKRICKYCKKELEFNKGKEFGAHVRNCLSNPNLKNIYQKISQIKKKEIKEYKFNCQKCGKEFILYLREKEVLSLKRRKCCSRQCANSKICSEENKRKKSEANKKWSQLHPRVIISKGKYKTIQINKKGYQEHRYIMEQFLKRKLENNEIVHHKNNNKEDNRIENLQLMTKNEHSKYHRAIEKALTAKLV